MGTEIVFEAAAKRQTKDKYRGNVGSCYRSCEIVW